MAAVMNEKNIIEPEQSQFQEPNELIELNEEQKQFLAECETEFSNRYTDDDLDYFNNKKKRDYCKKEPPIVENWWSRQSKRRDNDWDRRKRGRDNQEHQYSGRHKKYIRHSRFN